MNSILLRRQRGYAVLLVIVAAYAGCSGPTPVSQSNNANPAASKTTTNPTTPNSIPSSQAVAEPTNSAPTTTAPETNIVAAPNTSSNAPTPVEQPGVDDPHAPAKQLFADKGCVRCHQISGVALPMASAPAGGGGRGGGGFGGGFGGGPGGPGGRSRAPDLAKVSADPNHTSEWIAAYIRNPKSQNPQARMPQFGAERLSDEELRVLVEFLSTLKGE